MAAAVAAAKAKFAAGGEDGLIYGIYDLDGKAQELQVKTNVAKHGINKARVAKSQYVVDVMPVLKPGLAWASDSFGRGHVVDGRRTRPVTLDDLKVHPNGGLLHIQVRKHGVKVLQEVSFNPETNYLKHDSTYNGLNWDAAIVAAAWWIKNNLAEYNALFDFVGGELNLLNQPFTDGVEQKVVTREEMDARKAKSGPKTDPHSERSKVAARAPRTTDPVDAARANDNPVANQLRNIHVMWPWGGGFKSETEGWRVDELIELQSKSNALLLLAATGKDPSNAVSRHLLPEMQEFIARMQALVSGIDDTPPDIPNVMPQPKVVAVLIRQPVGVNLSALKLVKEATGGKITRKHEHWKDYRQRLYEWKDDLARLVTEARPDLWLEVRSRNVTVGYDASEDCAVVEQMPVYRLLPKDDEAPVNRAGRGLEPPAAGPNDGPPDDAADCDELDDEDMDQLED